MPITRRSTSGERGPRSTRSPRKTAVRPGGGRTPGAGWPSSRHHFRRHLIAEGAQQRHQLVEAAVHVADDVERSAQLAPVGWQAQPLDHGAVRLLRRAQQVDVAEALARQPPERTAQVLRLAPDDVRPEAPVGALPAAVLTEPLRQVEHDGHRLDVVRPGEGHQRAARVRLHVGGVDHGQAPASQTLRGDGVQQLESVRRRLQAVLVVADQGAEASEESTSVGRKCRRAKVDLPELETPIRTTSESSGTVSLGASRPRAPAPGPPPGSSLTIEHPHLRRRPEAASSGPTG